MSPKENSYNLEKTVWSEANFEKMGWHDGHVHGISFGKVSEENGTADFLLDVDYIFQLFFCFLDILVCLWCRVTYNRLLNKDVLSLV